MTYRIFTASLGAICTLAFGQAAFAASQGKVSQTIDRAALFTQLDVDGNGGTDPRRTGQSWSTAVCQG